MGAAYSQAPNEGSSSDRSLTAQDAPIYENISEYQSSKLPLLTECMETWKEIYNAKRLITYSDFDSIFGPILGDPDEHFGLFTGDDVKRRMKIKQAAIAAFKKSNPEQSGSGPLRGTGRRTTRAGSVAFRGSISGPSGGSISMAALGIGFANSGDGNMSIAKMAYQSSMMNKESGKVVVTQSQIDKYRRGAAIDVYEVFTIIALLGDEELEAKFMFIFKLYAMRGSRQGGVDSKQVSPCGGRSAERERS